MTRKTLERAGFSTTIINRSVRSVAALKKLTPFQTEAGYDLVAALHNNQVTATTLRQAGFSTREVRKATRQMEAQDRIADAIEKVSPEEAKEFRQSQEIDLSTALRGGAAMSDLTLATGISHTELGQINQQIGEQTRTSRSLAQQEAAQQRLMLGTKTPSVALSIQQGKEVNLVSLLVNDADPEDLITAGYDEKAITALVALRPYFHDDGTIDLLRAVKDKIPSKTLRAAGFSPSVIAETRVIAGSIKRQDDAQERINEVLERRAPREAKALKKGEAVNLVTVLALGTKPADLITAGFDAKTVRAHEKLRPFFIGLPTPDFVSFTINLQAAQRAGVSPKALQTVGFSKEDSRSRPTPTAEPLGVPSTPTAPKPPIATLTPEARKVPPPGEKFPVPQWLKDDLKEVKVSPVPAGPAYIQPGASGLPQEAFRNVQERAIKEATKRYQVGELTELETKVFVAEIKKQPPRSQNLRDVGYLVPGLGTYMSYQDMQRSGGAPLETGFFVVSAALDTVLFVIPLARGFRITAIPKAAVKAIPVFRLLSPTKVKAASASEQGGGRIRVSPNKRLSGSMTASEINRELDRIQALPKVTEKPRDRGLQKLVEISKDQDHQRKLEELRAAYTRQRPAPAKVTPPTRSTPPGRGRQLDSPFSRWELERQRQRVRQGLKAEEIARLSRRRRITPAETEQLAERMLRSMGRTSKLIGGKGVTAPLTQAEYRILTGLLSKKKALSKTQAEQLRQLLTHTQPSPTINTGLKASVVAQPRTKLENQTRSASSAPPSTATQTNTKPLSQTETATLTELLTKTRLRTDTQTETATESATKTRPLSQTETATLTELLTKTRLLNQTDTANLTDLASKTRPLTSTETTLLNKLLTKTSPATASTTKTKTKTQLKPRTLPITGSTATRTGRARKPPPPGGDKPKGKLRIPPFNLPGGKTLKAGTYPGIVTWKQGLVRVRLDMRTSQATYRKLRNPGVPNKTFRVVSTSAKTPDPRTLPLGVVDVVITRQGLTFVRSGRGSTLEDTVFTHPGPSFATSGVRMTNSSWIAIGITLFIVGVAAAQHIWGS